MAKHFLVQPFPHLHKQRLNTFASFGKLVERPQSILLEIPVQVVAFLFCQQFMQKCPAMMHALSIEIQCNAGDGLRLFLTLPGRRQCDGEIKQLAHVGSFLLYNASFPSYRLRSEDEGMIGYWCTQHRINKPGVHATLLTKPVREPILVKRKEFGNDLHLAFYPICMYRELNWYTLVCL